MKEIIKQFVAVLAALLVAFFICDSFVQARNKNKEGEKSLAEMKAIVDNAAQRAKEMGDTAKFFESLKHANPPERPAETGWKK